METTNSSDERFFKLSKKQEQIVASYSANWEMLFHPTKGYLYISAGCKKICGYSAEEVAKMPNFLEQITQPDDAERVRKHANDERNKNHDRCIIEFRIRHKNGTTRWIEHHCQTVYDESGELLGYLSNNYDISHRKGVEHQNKQLLQTIQEGKRLFAHGKVVLLKWWNERGWPIEFISDSVENVLGYTPNELDEFKFDFANLIHPADTDLVVQDVRQNTRNKVASFSHKSYRLITKSGKPIWVLDYTEAVWDSENEVSYFLTYILDVSAKVAERNKLMESEQKFKKAFDTNPSISFICEAKTGTVTEINASLTAKLGFEPSDLIGKTTEETFQVDLKAIASTNEGDNQWLEDLVLKNKQGQEVPVLLACEVITVGQMDLLFASAIDISGYQKNQVLLEQKHQRLEEMLKMSGDALRESVKELMKSENLYRDIIKNMQDVYFRTTPTGAITIISPSVKKLLDYKTIEDLIGKNFYDVLFQEQDTLRRFHQLLDKQGEVKNFEIQYNTRASRPIDLLISSQFFFDDEGVPQGVEGVLKDVTQHRKTEKALKFSEDKYQRFIEKTQDAIALYYKGIIDYVNPKFTELFGYKQNELHDGEAGHMSFILEEQRDALRQILEQRAKTKEISSQHDFVGLNKQGEHVQLQLEIMQIPYKADYAEQIILKDISEKKKSEEQLRKLTERLSLATESAELGVWEIDVQQQKLFWDLQMYHLYESDPEKYENAFQAMVKQLHPEDTGVVFNALEESLSNGQRLEIEFRIITPQKKLKYLKAFGKLSFNEHDVATRMTGITYDISESKMYEQALKKAETNYRTVADFTYDWETWYAASGELLYCSPSCARITGYTQDEFLADPKLLLKIAHPKDKPLIDKLLSPDLISRQQHYSVEFRLITKSKRIIWIGHDVQQVYDADLNYMGVRGSSRDISKAKQNLAKLKDRTKQLAMLNTLLSKFAGANSEPELNALLFEQIIQLSGAEVVCYSTIRHGVFRLRQCVNADPKYKAVTALLQKQIVSCRLPRHIKLALTTNAYVQVNSLLEVIPGEFITPALNKELMGQLRQLQIYMFPICQANALMGFFCVFLPKSVTTSETMLGTVVAITKQAAIVLQRLSTNEKLLQSMKEWKNFIANANTPIIGVNHKGKINEWNNAAQKVTGYSLSDVQGKSLVTEFVYTEYQAPVSAAIEKALQGHETSNFQFPILVRHKKRVIFLMDLTPRKNEDGETIGAIGVGQDITEIDYLRSELESERASLAQRVKDRTKELQSANNQLAKAAKLKDEFLANMSHELRTPLNAILGLSESLTEHIYGPLNDRQTKKINDIEESGRHLLSLINEILDLAKIEAGKIELNYDAINIESLCWSSLRFIKQTAFKKKIDVQQSISCLQETFEGDEKRMRQVLVNLLSNAVKFTPEGGALGLRVKADNKANIIFEVWDEGIGIDPADFSRLFKPFEQLDSSLSRNYEGTGLGLALVKKLVVLHQGDVSVASALGKGSSFKVKIPLSVKNMPAKVSIAEKLPVQKPAYAKLKGKLALIVDDHEINITALKEYLIAKQMRVKVAYNGLEALQEIESLPPDIIIMDIQMPRMDGLEATRAIRQHQNKEISNIPVIALTALAMPGDKAACLAAGADEYMKKPVSLKGLLELITKHLEK